MLDLNGAGFHFFTEDYGDGAYPRKDLPKPARRMFITQDGQVGINRGIDLTTWVNENATLGVGGDVAITGDLTVNTINGQAPGKMSAAASGGALVPVGGIIDWWRPDEATAVPDGFQLCDGAMISEGPYKGEATPDLNSSSGLLKLMRIY